MVRQKEMKMNEDEHDELASWEEDEDSILDFAPDDGPRDSENDDYHHEDM